MNPVDIWLNANGRLILICYLLPLGISIYLYAKQSGLPRTPVGRLFLAKDAVVFLILCVSAVTVALGQDFAGRGFVLAGLFTLINIVGWYQVKVLLDIAKKYRDNGNKIGD